MKLTTKAMLCELTFQDINEVLNGSESSTLERLAVLEMLKEIGGDSLIIRCKEVLPKVLQEHHKITNEHMQ